MGFWGIDLYSNDVALDVKADYVKLINNEKDFAEATQKLIKIYKVDESYDEDVSIFWVVLADQQWQRGILEEYVKSNALKHIDLLCKSATPISKSVLKGMCEKICSPQPSVRTKTTAKPYHCQWKTGDVYAYPISSDYAKQYNLCGEYFLFYKIGETVWYPEHIIPVVWVKITKNGKLPTNEAELNELEYVQTGVTIYEDRFFPFTALRPRNEQIEEKMKIEYKRDEYGHLPQYRMVLINTSKRIIPKSLLFIGNFDNITPPPNEHIPPEISITGFVWRHFEDCLIDRYSAYNLKNSSLYSIEHRIK